jgi:hypothetical protein
MERQRRYEISRWGEDAVQSNCSANRKIFKFRGMDTLIDDIRESIKSVGGRVILGNLIIQQTPGWFDIQTRRYFKRRAEQADRYVKKRVRSNGWSEDDVEYLLRNYGKMPVSRLARTLGRTHKATCRKFYLIATPERISEVPVLTRGKKYGKI